MRSTYRQITRARALAISAVLLAWTLAWLPSTARAESAPPAPATPEDDTDDTRVPHGALSVGWLVAVTGPLGLGFAADLEFFPAGPFGRYGFGAYYRSNFAGDRGMVSAGMTFEAGATRPKLVMSLHADIGFTHGPALPVVGAGVRSQLAVLGPLVLASNATGHFIIDGSDSRLALALVLTAGISR